jgi:hypothetical protein
LKDLWANALLFDSDNEEHEQWLLGNAARGGQAWPPRSLLVAVAELLQVILLDRESGAALRRLSCKVSEQRDFQIMTLQVRIECYGFEEDVLSKSFHLDVFEPVCKVTLRSGPRA